MLPLRLSGREDIPAEPAVHPDCVDADTERRMPAAGLATVCPLHATQTHAQEEGRRCPNRTRLFSD